MGRNLNVQDGQAISGKQRFVYFMLIPALFTSMLLGIFYFLVQSGNSDTFASAMINAGHNALSSGSSLMGKFIPKKASPTNKPVPPASGQDSGANPSPSASNPGTGATPIPSETVVTTSQANGGNSSPAPAKDPSHDSAAFLKSAADMAAPFNKMPVAQAGSLLSSLPLKEQLTVMLGMSQPQRAALLAKMQTKDAAKLLQVLGSVPAIVTDDNLPQITVQLDKIDSAQKPIDTLVSTYNQLPAANAAALITELLKSDPNTAELIVKRMDEAPRTQLLSSLSSGKPGSDQLKVAVSLAKQLAK